MRKKHAITAARIREVLHIDSTGLISFRQENHLHKIGHLPRIKWRGERAYIRIDLKEVNLLSAAWVLQTGHFPQWPLRQKRFSMFDFRLDNLCRGVRGA